MMRNITSIFSNIYLPDKALVLYRSISKESDVYVEAYDMDDNGKSINVHPLSLKEAAELAAHLNTSTDLNKDFLTTKGLLPDNLLYLKSNKQGFAVWFTPSHKLQLFFKEALLIPCGEAFVLAMVWKAERETLHVYAIANDKKSSINTSLYHAPFFNVYSNGNVCMGSVDVEIETNCCLEDFIKMWQSYFFNSYFSHMVSEHIPVKTGFKAKGNLFWIPIFIFCIVFTCVIPIWIVFEPIESLIGKMTHETNTNTLTWIVSLAFAFFIYRKYNFLSV